MHLHWAASTWQRTPWPPRGVQGRCLQEVTCTLALSRGRRDALYEWARWGALWALSSFPFWVGALRAAPSPAVGFCFLRSLFFCRLVVLDDDLSISLSLCHSFFPHLLYASHFSPLYFSPLFLFLSIILPSFTLSSTPPSSATSSSSRHHHPSPPTPDTHLIVDVIFLILPPPPIPTSSSSLSYSIF